MSEKHRQCLFFLCLTPHAAPPQHPPSCRWVPWWQRRLTPAQPSQAELRCHQGITEHDRWPPAGDVLGCLWHLPHLCLGGRQVISLFFFPTFYMLLAVHVNVIPTPRTPMYLLNTHVFAVHFCVLSSYRTCPPKRSDKGVTWDKRKKKKGKKGNENKAKNSVEERLLCRAILTAQAPPPLVPPPLTPLTLHFAPITDT